MFLMQCDHIGEFLKVFGDKYSFKCAKIFVYNPTSGRTVTESSTFFTTAYYST